MMDGEQEFQRWIDDKQRAEIPDGFADRVMAAIQVQQADDVRRRLLVRMLLAAVASRPGKLAACLLAFLFGMTPFLYLVYLTQLFGVSTAAGLTL